VTAAKEKKRIAKRSAFIPCMLRRLSAELPHSLRRVRDPKKRKAPAHVPESR
jgi:hypothetical protein